VLASAIVLCAIGLFGLAVLVAAMLNGCL
jgi:hypothetical protein